MVGRRSGLSVNHWYFGRKLQYSISSICSTFDYLAKSSEIVNQTMATDEAQACQDLLSQAKYHLDRAKSREEQERVFRQRQVSIILAIKTACSFNDLTLLLCPTRKRNVRLNARSRQNCRPRLKPFVLTENAVSRRSVLSSSRRPNRLVLTRTLS